MNGIFVQNVVERIKCELAMAFADRLTLPGTVQRTAGEGKGRELPSWLADWTIKADLYLEANEEGGISPSGSYTAFRKSAVNAAAGPSTFPGTTLGTVSQSFSLTLTANASEQAVRNETLSFTLALKELNAWYGDGVNACITYARDGLTGYLGIGEWIDTSLSTIDSQVLEAGKHPTPNSSSKPSSPPIVAAPKAGGLAPAFAPKPLSPTEAAREREKLEQNVKDADTAIADAQKNYNSIKSSINALSKTADKTADLMETYRKISTPETVSHMKQTLQRLDEYKKSAKQAQMCAAQQICGDSYGDCSGFKLKDKAGGGKTESGHKSSQPEMTCENISIACNAPHDTISGITSEAACVKDLQNEAMKFPQDTTALTDSYLKPSNSALKEAQSYLDNTKQLASFAQRLAKTAAPETPDPPVDSLGHFIEFVVAYGGGITPSWSLIALKGPGLNPPLVSGTVNRTHILQLALGSPTRAAGTQEQNRILNNQILLNH